MAWLWLIAAGLCEVVGVVGFTHLSRGQRASGLALTVGGFATGLIGLHAAMATIPMGLAYSVFTGIGTLGSALMGILFWGDSARPARLAWVGGIMVTGVGLRLSMRSGQGR